MKNGTCLELYTLAACVIEGMKNDTFYIFGEFCYFSAANNLIARLPRTQKKYKNPLIRMDAHNKFPSEQQIEQRSKQHWTKIHCLKLCSLTCEQIYHFVHAIGTNTARHSFLISS